MYYWDGAFWKPIATGGTGGGTPGPQGPPGRDGESVNVFVQNTVPTPVRAGDFWINDAAARSYISVDQMVTYPTFDTKTYASLDSLKTYPSLDDVKGQ
jgi:hypothetical protein